jgi:signal transduction histidine kinase
MHDRGTLTLRTGQRPTVFGPAWVTLAIEDTGSGIDMRELNRVFGDFYTTKPHGSGLGLSFVRRVVRAHGGRFSLTSKVNRGTTVRLEFRALAKPDRGNYAIG